MKPGLLKNIDYGVYHVGINIWLLKLYFVYYSIIKNNMLWKVDLVLN